MVTIETAETRVKDGENEREKIVENQEVSGKFVLYKRSSEFVHVYPVFIDQLGDRS